MFKCKHCGELNEPNPNKHICECGAVYWRIDHSQPYPDNGKYDEYWAKRDWACWRDNGIEGPGYYGRCSGEECYFCDRVVP